VSKRSGAVIPWPKDTMRARKVPRNATAGPRDTAPDVVAAVTYAPPAELLP
jgi:hypothetical protein